ncbi:MAG: radical SAM protein, partial [Firmicutes bacterium]|nr:radical SAM protein [Bacillota bacterium]
MNKRPYGTGWKRFQQRLYACIDPIRVNVHQLKYFFWEATLRCNLSCRHCGSDCHADGGAADLPGSLAVEVLHDIARHYQAERIMVNVTGGEPLLRPDLFDVLGEAHGLGFPWGMVTNGMLVDARVIDACIRTGMRTVSVSLDGTAETHNWLRNNPLSHGRALRALVLFAEARAFETVEAITCVHRGNIDQLPALYDDLRRLGVNAWRLFTIFPRGRALANPELLPDRELLSRLLAFIARTPSKSQARKFAIISAKPCGVLASA